ncbi:RNA-binding S4 domain-containing protein [Luteithermobacter gelatinilyticus]|uniref:RNA-binding S4 domain-containing protein n=1 Tax=Luteithermobacter gelatinilyticus TaxID=2582913 RepID=UPI001106C652|nr:RNA-binding S4 domain-containing protein [Luteithermobacter gelatinilyticus]
MTEQTKSQRLDVWLWHARFFKTRTLATKICRGGKVRLNGQTIKKASVMIGTEDVITFPQGGETRIARVRALGLRRGPAAEARELYEDLTPPRAPKSASPKIGQRDKGAGRPTKAERRALDKFRDKFGK